MRGSSQLGHLDFTEQDILEPQIASELEKSMDELKNEKAQYEKYCAHLQNEISTLFDKNEKLLSCLNTRQITVKTLTGRYEDLERAIAGQNALKERLLKIQQKLKELRRKKDPDDPKRVLKPLLQNAERECENREKELEQVRLVMLQMIETAEEFKELKMQKERAIVKNEELRKQVDALVTEVAKDGRVPNELESLLFKLQNNASSFENLRADLFRLKRNESPGAADENGQGIVDVVEKYEEKGCDDKMIEFYKRVFGMHGNEADKEMEADESQEKANDESRNVISKESEEGQAEKAENTEGGESVEKVDEQKAKNNEEKEKEQNNDEQTKDNEKEEEKEAKNNGEEEKEEDNGDEQAKDKEEEGKEKDNGDEQANDKEKEVKDNDEADREEKTKDDDNKEETKNEEEEKIERTEEKEKEENDTNESGKGGEPDKNDETDSTETTEKNTKTPDAETNESNHDSNDGKEDKTVHDNDYSYYYEEEDQHEKEQTEVKKDKRSRELLLKKMDRNCEAVTSMVTLMKVEKPVEPREKTSHFRRTIPKPASLDTEIRQIKDKLSKVSSENEILRMQLLLSKRRDKNTETLVDIDSLNAQHDSLDDLQLQLDELEKQCRTEEKELAERKAALAELQKENARKCGALRRVNQTLETMSEEDSWLSVLSKKQLTKLTELNETIRHARKRYQDIDARIRDLKNIIDMNQRQMLVKTQKTKPDVIQKCERLRTQRVMERENLRIIAMNDTERKFTDQLIESAQQSFGHERIESLKAENTQVRNRCKKLKRKFYDSRATPGRARITLTTEAILESMQTLAFETFQTIDSEKKQQIVVYSKIDRQMKQLRQLRIDIPPVPPCYQKPSNMRTSQSTAT